MNNNKMFIIIAAIVVLVIAFVILGGGKRTSDTQTGIVVPTEGAVVPAEGDQQPVGGGATIDTELQQLENSIEGINPGDLSEDDLSGF